MRIDSHRLLKRLEKLSEFGLNEDGGISRPAFSDSDIKGRDYIKKLMVTAGLTIKIDAAGNIIGRKEGKIKGLPAIAMGSHIDTVSNGGKFDGALGVISAIETIQTLKENNYILSHPVEVIVFVDEEGSMIGSRAICGALETETTSSVGLADKKIGESLKDIGGDPDNLCRAKREMNEFLCFMELHIEQGGILENNKIDIGVVEGIVGIRHWDVHIQGIANHAGTTPMDQRQDALLAASHLIVKVNETVKHIKGSQVATIGTLDIKSASPNVIPGNVELVLEIRDISEEKILKVYDKIEEEADLIAKSTGVNFTIIPNDAVAIPATMNEKLRIIIAESAQKEKYSYMVIPSGAGHDSQNMTKLTPTGMIFVPSAGGISHSPKEYTQAAFCEKGANVLLNAVIIADDRFSS